MSADAPAAGELDRSPDTLPGRSEIEKAALHYQLALPERQQSKLVGELAGRRTGSSIEFQDRKDYTFGDDLRAIDWRAYARTDRLTVKMYREEICPSVEIVVDTSASMSVTNPKRQRNIELAYLFFLMAHKLHARVRVHDLGRNMARLPHALALQEAPGTAQENPLPLLHASGLSRRGGIHILLSDLLFPFDPAELMQCFGASDRLVIVQTLSAFEANPTAGQAVRLEDAETAQHLDVRLDRQTVEGYRRRLGALQSEVERRAMLAGGVFVTHCDEDAFADTLRLLLEKGVIEA